MDGDSASANVLGLAGSGDLNDNSCETAEARRVASEDDEEEVASFMYSTTSHVCNVASGANDTRRLAKDFRLACFRLNMSAAVASFAWLNIGLTEGNADYNTIRLR